jgi:hypothetical protein
LVALALLILGFLVRRTLGPAALHYLTDRPPVRSTTTGDSTNPHLEFSRGSVPLDDNSAKPSLASNPTPIATAERNPPPSERPALVHEKLTADDRQQLDSIVREQSK